MERILIINPNSSISCTDGISEAVEGFRAPGLPRIDVMRIAEGPPAIVNWRHWHSVAELVCRMVETEAASAYIIGCVSDPGFEAARAIGRGPVFGMLRSAITAALSRADSFGVIGFTDASRERQNRAFWSLGVDARLAAWIPLNLDMEVLTDPVAPRARICAVARELAAQGARSIVLGCAGMAKHRAAAEDAAGVPVIEPAQAAVGQALAAVLAGREMAGLRIAAE
ncbi:MAG: aspartate/glutamate racemase family protein [Alphaproteobacteria bacterium]|nr:aspartate/glutamate racemase family protein [Alphaproteobacteria bacterium]